MGALAACVVTGLCQRAHGSGHAPRPRAWRHASKTAGQIENENYLLATEEQYTSEIDVIDYSLSVQNILRYLEAKTNQVNILILDACRDNPFENNWNKTRSIAGQGLAKIPPPTGSLIAFSTDLYAKDAGSDP